MDALEAIKTRRSVRNWTSEPVPPEIIRQILEAAMYAPSAGDEQAWQFVVIQDRGLLDQAGDVNPYARISRLAPLGILVCGDTSLEKYTGFWVQDCSAATQNLLVAAHSLGLGGVWTGIYPEEGRVRGFKKLYGLPENVIPLGLLLLGYPDQKPSQPKRYKAERVHQDRFGRPWG